MIRLSRNVQPVAAATFTGRNADGTSACSVVPRWHAAAPVELASLYLPYDRTGSTFEEHFSRSRQDAFFSIRYQFQAKAVQIVVHHRP